jgi:methylphosphotriester-DNA--protein-cysteine methyltransferase
VTIAADLAESLRTTPVLPRDAVTVALAQRYAAALDDCFDELIGAGRPCPRCRAEYDDSDAAEAGAAHARIVLEINRLGARLEATLDRLGMSPGARPAVRGAEGQTEHDPARAALEQLERDTAAGAPNSGVDYAAALDPAVAAALAEE